MAPGLPRSGPEPHTFDDLNALGSNVRLTQEQVGRLRQALDRATAARDEALRLADLPAGRYPLAFTKDYISTKVPHLQKARECCELLRWEAWRRAHEWDPNGALRACRGQLNAGRSIGEEPFSISQLVRIAIQVQAIRALERILAQAGPSETALADAQRLFTEEMDYPTLLVMMRCERVWTHICLTRLADGAMKWVDYFYWFESRDQFTPTERAALDRRMAEAARRLHPRALRFGSQVVEIAKLRPPQWLPRFTKLRATLADVPESERELFVNPEKLASACLRLQALLRTAVVGLALERYRRQHQHWPATLAELTPGLLTAVPRDPYDGAPLHYRRLADGVVVYSVGADGKDDGGKVDPIPNALAPPVDLGFHLWDVVHRRQAASAKRQAAGGAVP